MKCVLSKPGIECVFAFGEICKYNTNGCKEIVENCKGCEKVCKVGEKTYCLSFPDPPAKWRNKKCTMATHIKDVIVEKEEIIDPIKASKRSVGAKKK